MANASPLPLPWVAGWSQRMIEYRAVEMRSLPRVKECLLDSGEWEFVMVYIVSQVVKLRSEVVDLDDGNTCKGAS